MTHKFAFLSLAKQVLVKESPASYDDQYSL